MSQEARFYFYRIAVAVIPLLVLLGLIGPEVGEHVIEIVLAVLGLSVALPAQAKSNPKKVAVVEVDENVR